MPDNNNFINWWHLKLQIVSMGRKQFSADFQLMFRLLKLFLFIGAIVSMTLMFTLLSLTTGDIFASLLAFLPTAWAIIQVLVYFILFYFW
jgi:callose synthase